MIFSKANCTVVKVASKDGHDNALNGVKFEPDGTTIGSNGNTLLVVSPANKDKANFPPEAGDEFDIDSRGLVLPIDVVEKVSKQISRKGKLSYQYIGLTKVKDEARVGCTSVDELGNPNTYAALPKNEEYPPWENMLRGLRGGVRICLNRKDLIDLLSAIEAACPDKGGINPLFIELDPDGRGLLLRCINYDTQQHVIGGINKYDTKGKWLDFNKWELKLFKLIRKVVKKK